MSIEELEIIVNEFIAGKNKHTIKQIEDTFKSMESQRWDDAGYKKFKKLRDFFNKFKTSNKQSFTKEGFYIFKGILEKKK